MEKSKLKKEFQAVEKKLHSLLKNSKVIVSDNDDEEIVKQNIKNHIEMLGEIRLLFDEYERLAKLLFIGEDDDNSPLLLKEDEQINQKPLQENTEIQTKTTSKKMDKKSVKEKNFFSEISKNA